MVSNTWGGQANRFRMKKPMQSAPSTTQTLALAQWTDRIFFILSLSHRARPKREVTKVHVHRESLRVISPQARDHGKCRGPQKDRGSARKKKTRAWGKRRRGHEEKGDEGMRKKETRA
jgi:hypothetical protein